MELRTDRFVPILRELRDLLLEYGDVEHATIIADLLDVAQLGRPEFVTRVQSGEIWGAAAGTIVDIAWRIFRGRDPYAARGASVTDFLRTGAQLARASKTGS